MTVPLQEDQPYDFTILGPNGFQQRFAGVLDCETQDSAAGAAVQTLSDPSPALAGGAPATGVNLAETGSSSATPMIAGMAIVLLVIGGGVVLLVGKKEQQGAGARK